MPRSILPTRIQLAIGTFGFILAVNGVAAFAQAPADGARRVRALLVVDYNCNPPLPGLAENYREIKGLLDWMYSKDPSTVSVDEMTGTVAAPTISPQQVLDYYKSLADVRNDEVLLCYYAGHGATDPDKGHWLAMSGGGLPRAELRRTMETRRPRGVILLTDCCSSVATFPVAAAAMAAPLATKGRTDIERILHDLFFRHTGTVDVTAATYHPETRSGEYAWFQGTGGIFTESLYYILFFAPGGFAALDGNADGIVTWQETVSRLDSNMNQRYGLLRGRYLASDPSSLGPDDLQTYFMMKQQPRQTPQAFSLGVPAVPAHAATAPAVSPGPSVSPSPAPSPLTPVAPTPVRPSPVTPTGPR